MLQADDLAEIRRMRNDGFGIEDTAVILGVPAGEVRAAFRAGLPPLVERKPRARDHTRAEGPAVSPRQLAERAARAVAPARDLTAALMGDPPVGFSALDLTEAP